MDSTDVKAPLYFTPRHPQTPHIMSIKNREGYEEAENAAIAAAAILGEPHEVWLVALHDSILVNTRTEEEQVERALSYPDQTCFVMCAEPEDGDSICKRVGGTELVICLFWVAPNEACELIDKKQRRNELYKTS